MFDTIEKHAAGAMRPAQQGYRPQLSSFDRRSLLKLIGGSAAFTLAMRLEPATAYVPYPTGADKQPGKVVTDPYVFVAIASDGAVTIVNHRCEMGTGIRTSLPMLIADEMGCDWARVKIIQAPADEPKYGSQNVDGSRSMRHFVQPMRQIGASVRLMLEQAAAQRWGVQHGLAKAALHEVIRLEDQNGRLIETSERLGYGALAEDAMKLPVPSVEQIVLKRDEQLRYVGKGELSIYDLRDITAGKAAYGADIRLPGMKYAVVARPPVVGSSIKSFDASATMKVAGVERIVEIPITSLGSGFAPLGGIAVVASNTFSAIKGRDALKIEWNSSPHTALNSDSYYREMSDSASKPGKRIRTKGDPDAAFANAARIIRAEYSQPHTAHVSMEPPVAVADVRSQHATVHAPVQNAYLARTDVAKLVGLAVENVTLMPTLLGGAFGRKSQHDFVLEAAFVSKAIGAPVKLQWTREDDIRHCFNHAASVEALEAAVDSRGRISGWRHRTVAPTILSTFAPDPGYEFPLEFGLGFIDTPFAIPNMALENGPISAHARIGWFRSVLNVPRAFAIQSFVAELAHELGRDPKDMLLDLIGPARKLDLKSEGIPEGFWNYDAPYDEFPIDTGRLRHVVDLAARQSGWGRTLPNGEGLGIAAHRSFVSYTAAVVHTKIDDDGSIRVPEVHLVIDCGFCINPERVKSQLEGAAVMGLTLSLYSGLNYVDGQVQESNFSDYPVARMDRAPLKVNVHIVDHPSSVHPSGVGEPGLPPFAPALANAIFAATGKRLRKLPFGELLT